LEVEIGLLDGWARFWYKGELMDLPADLRADWDRSRQEKAEEKRRGEEEKRRADKEKARADEEKRRADVWQKRLEAAERMFPELRKP
jgi:hypothetical protein